MSQKASIKRPVKLRSLAGFALAFASSAFGQAREFTSDRGSRGFAWSATGNWLGPSGQWPDDWYDKAVLRTKGSLGDPILTHGVQGNIGGALGQLALNSAGWTFQNEAGGDYTMYLDSVQSQYTINYQHNAQNLIAIEIPEPAGLGSTDYCGRAVARTMISRKEDLTPALFSPPFLTERMVLHVTS